MNEICRGAASREASVATPITPTTATANQVSSSEAPPEPPAPTLLPSAIVSRHQQLPTPPATSAAAPSPQALDSPTSGGAASPQFSPSEAVAAPTVSGSPRPLRSVLKPSKAASPMVEGFSEFDILGHPPPSAGGWSMRLSVDHDAGNSHLTSSMASLAFGTPCSAAHHTPYATPMSTPHAAGQFCFLPVGSVGSGFLDRGFSFGTPISTTPKTSFTAVAISDARPTPKPPRGSSSRTVKSFTEVVVPSELATGQSEQNAQQHGSPSSSLPEEAAGREIVDWESVSSSGDSQLGDGSREKVLQSVPASYRGDATAAVDIVERLSGDGDGAQSPADGRRGSGAVSQLRDDEREAEGENLAVPQLSMQALQPLDLPLQQPSRSLSSESSGGPLDSAKVRFAKSSPSVHEYEAFPWDEIDDENFADVCPPELMLDGSSESEEELSQGVHADPNQLIIPLLRNRRDLTSWFANPSQADLAAAGNPFRLPVNTNALPPVIQAPAPRFLPPDMPSLSSDSDPSETAGNCTRRFSSNGGSLAAWAAARGGNHVSVFTGGDSVASSSASHELSGGDITGRGSRVLPTGFGGFDFGSLGRADDSSDDDEDDDEEDRGIHFAEEGWEAANCHGTPELQPPGAVESSGMTLRLPTAVARGGLAALPATTAVISSNGREHDFAMVAPGEAPSLSSPLGERRAAENGDETGDYGGGSKRQHAS